MIFGCGGEESVNKTMVETMGDEKRNEAMPISNDSWQSGNTMTGVGEVGFAEALAIARNLPSLKEVEPLVIEEALKRADGNQTIAA